MTVNDTTYFLSEPKMTHNHVLPVQGLFKFLPYKKEPNYSQQEIREYLENINNSNNDTTSTKGSPEL